MSDDLTRLVHDLTVAGEKAQEQSHKALKVEGHQMRDDWRAVVSGARGLPGLARALSYDVRATGLRELTAEVGYDKVGQGNLGNIVEYGSSQQGPIRPAGERVLNDGASRLEKFLAGLDPL